MPGNPQRPLAVFAPDPADDARAVVRHVEEIAWRGYGGMVLDPASFGALFLSETWFRLVELYVEACRLTGLFLWLLDGFTIGDAFPAWLDEHLPVWRGPEIVTRSIAVQGPERAELSLPGPAEGRCLGLLARDMDGTAPPINLLACSDGSRLRWDPPSGRWEVISFLACAAPRSNTFNWSDSDVVASWLQVGFEPYRSLFPSHLGRTIQGFLVRCPVWPAPKPCGQESTWPLAGNLEPSWLELAGFMSPVVVGKGSYPARLAMALRQSYLAPLREWCWRNHLRIAGYRLGGLPLPWLTADLDFGGLPDLTPGAAADPLELACLAGAARRHRQEKVVCQLSLTGEMLRDRASVSRLTAAGANLLLVRREAAYARDCELALADYAARVVMAVAAGRPAAEMTLTIGEDPRELPAYGREVLALTKRGFEVRCVPEPGSGAADDNQKAPAGAAPVDDATTAEAAAAAERGLSLPEPLCARARKVEEWTLYTIFNHARERWRGPVELPAIGATEIWSPSTGEKRSIAPLTAIPSLCIPMALESGEAALAVVKRPGLPSLQAPSQLVEARLNLQRSWEFQAVGGNILPLDWEEYAPGNWSTEIVVQARPADIRFEEKPEGILWLNGELLAGESTLALDEYIQIGKNRFELRGARRKPNARLRGEFICRGGAISQAGGTTAGPWNLNGYPYFTGPGVYRQTVSVPSALIRPDLAAWLEIAALAESALVRLNGEPVGALPWPPYRLRLGPATALRAGDNLLELEIHAPAGKDIWAFKGLLGEVTLFFAKLNQDTRQSELELGGFWP